MADILSDNIEYPQTAACACPRVEETVTTNYTDILEDFDAPCLVRSLVERCQALVTRCKQAEAKVDAFTTTCKGEWADIVRKAARCGEAEQDHAEAVAELQVLRDECVLLKEERDRLKRIIAGIRDWLDNYSDVEDRDGEDARPVPNWAMCGLQELERLEADRG